jgi:CRP-like cAMP-binding protein
MASPLTLFEQFELEHPAYFKLVEYKRNEHLIRLGEQERSVYLVKSGALKVVYSDENQEQIIRFGYRDSILTSLPAFFDNGKSLFDISAIRKSTVKVFDKQQLFNFIFKSPELQWAYILMLQDLVSQQIEREIDILTQSPLERYNRVLKRSPRLFQEVPARYIANYLRMSPEHLSRLRNIDLNQY